MKSPEQDDRVPPVSLLRPGNEPSWHRFIGPAIILFAALVAVTPELIHGNSCGHDFDFHLVSWFDALNAWRHGVPYPHWAPSANYGAGEPRFVFYSPLTWMMGAALGAFLPWTWVPIALSFLLLAGTGLATRALARQALNEGAATLAGCVALFSGYSLFTAYERTAFAELAGGVWIPLVLLFALRSSKAPDVAKSEHHQSAGSIAGLAIAIAGCWLSNPTVGVMGCYLLAAAALVVFGLERSSAKLLRTAAGAVLGMGLVAVYLVPASWEQRWVDIHQATQDKGETPEYSWLFAVHNDPALAYHDVVLHTVSTIAILMIGVALCALFLCWLRGRLPEKARWWVPLALIPVAVLLLQFPFSRPLWNLLPDLRFLQFPWRWLVVLEAPMGIFAAAAIWPRNSTHHLQRFAIAAAAGAVFLTLTTWAEKDLFQVCDDEDAVAGMVPVYAAGQGFAGTYEYEPIGADISLIAAGLPQACLVANPATVLGKPTENSDSDSDIAVVWSASQGTCEATYAAAHCSAPEHLKILANPPHTGFLVLKLRTYPAWLVKVNGVAIVPSPPRADGLMAVPVPAGPVVLTADWTTTTDVFVGRWLSALSVLALTGLCLLAREPKRKHLS
jgi:hypothetical protein